MLVGVSGSDLNFSLSTLANITYPQVSSLTLLILSFRLNVGENDENWNIHNLLKFPMEPLMLGTCAFASAVNYKELCK